MEKAIKIFDFKKGLPFEFEIKDLSIIKKSPKLFSGPFKATFYQLIWLSHGKATLSIDFRNITIKAGEAVIISVNQVYSMDILSEYQGKMILFTDSFFNRTKQDSLCLYSSNIMNPVRLNQVIRYSPQYMESLLFLLELELESASDIFQSDIVQRFLSALLLESERIVTSNKTENIHINENNIARTFLNEVEKHFKTNRKVEFYIDKLAVYEKTLTKEVKALSGKTPKQYIDTRIILETKRLLAYSTLSIKEIGFELGWDEATNFNKFFKKHTGITPLDFRDKYTMTEIYHN